MNYNIDIDGYIGPWAYSKQYVKGKLSEMKGKEVAVRMNSLGGSLDHGIDMAAQFRDHGNVTVYMFGFNASSATVASLGAKKTMIDANAFYLVHKVSNWVDVWGTLNADQMAAAIVALEKNKKENDKMDLVLARMYAKKTGKKVDDILDVLKEGGWLTAKEAYEYGFVDGIVNESTEKVNFSDDLKEKFNAFGLPMPGNDTSSEEGLFNRLFNRVKKELFPAGKANVTETGKSTNQQPVIEMKKDFLKVNALLGVEGIEFADGKANFTDEQVQKMNAELDTLAKENEEKEKQIANLKQNPGDETPEVKNDGKSDDSDEQVLARAEDLFKNVKDLI